MFMTLTHTFMIPSKGFFDSFVRLFFFLNPLMRFFLSQSFITSKMSAGKNGKQLDLDLLMQNQIYWTKVESVVMVAGCNIKRHKFGDL